ncbi:aminopeptidase N [Brevundimonas sp. 2R-24]|uniref:Aminopeptidase N n=1 Tax=Peiella sedimenti TaxID=3061083 RepID=A0ABT8SHY6_9CAUL|nr:aminopeptidase N [Caulobacteraceae bacterium XZ-24]
MRTETPPPSPEPIRLEDYRPPAFLIDTVELDFALEPRTTRVKARLAVRRNGDHAEPLVLDGDRLTPISVSVDGRALAPDEYTLTSESLTIPQVPDAFTLQTEVEIDPEGNTALAGLYMSGGRFCTQCEAEGFRRITWFPDRPDVLARYRVRMTADKARYPRLLSNGNLEDAGDLPGGRHFAVWSDPFPKPSYLFALVAGELDELADSFTTMSGREVALCIYVDPGQADRATYAMDALKRSMRWDEEAYGREYDLDLFMIVAVRDFNFGAMENKGLNIFNSSLLLADPRTATDLDYERIEAVVAHEYFHNWTGNRITCRDWFQLCVKEGLTVFRDRGFSADMRGAGVERIKAVKALKARQFPEDSGPLAHPPRPSSYVKIDNFYTATVYEKGAEIVGVLKTLVGGQSFRRAMDLYFDRHDGEAVTVEQFVACFAEAAGRDMAAELRWYEQAGRPAVRLSSSYDAAARTLTLDFAVEPPAVAGSDWRQPPIPVRLGLLSQSGQPQTFRFQGEGTDEALVVLAEERTSVTLEAVAETPVISALRGLSAPVDLMIEEPADNAYARLAGDPDLYNRWDAAQSLAKRLIVGRAEGKPDEVGERRYAEAVGRALEDANAEDAFKALLLAPPGLPTLIQAQTPADPSALADARAALIRAMTDVLGERLEALHDSLAPTLRFSPDAAQAGRRALRNAALDLLAWRGGEADVARAQAHFAAAEDMTTALGGLAALIVIGGQAAEAALADFHDRWKDEPLVLDKWFTMQALDLRPENLARIEALAASPAFDLRNPNRVRALVGTFSQSGSPAFHHPSGEGYAFLARQIAALDPLNPMVAARLVEPLGQWRRMTPRLAEPMRRALEQVLATPNLSKNVQELAAKALGDPAA